MLHHLGRVPSVTLFSPKLEKHPVLSLIEKALECDQNGRLKNIEEMYFVFENHFDLLSNDDLLFLFGKMTIDQHEFESFSLFLTDKFLKKCSEYLPDHAFESAFKRAVALQKKEYSGHERLCCCDSLFACHLIVFYMGRLQAQQIEALFAWAESESVSVYDRDLANVVLIQKLLVDPDLNEKIDTLIFRMKDIRVYPLKQEVLKDTLSKLYSQSKSSQKTCLSFILTYFQAHEQEKHLRDLASHAIQFCNGDVVAKVFKNIRNDKISDSF